MKNTRKIMEVALPVPEAADLALRAAGRGMPTPDYLGLLVLSAAYGVSHPVVAAAARVPNVGICGPETPGPDDAGA